MVDSQSVEPLMEGRTLGELDVFKSTDTAAADADGTAMETADAAAAIQASQVFPASTRSSAAMHRLMEQGMYIGIVCGA
jgi:hypothetical protein